MRVRAQLVQMGSEVDEDVDVAEGDALVLFRMKVEEARKLAPALTGDEVTLSIELAEKPSASFGLPPQFLTTVQDFARARAIPFEPYAALCRMVQDVVSLEGSEPDGDHGGVWERMVLDFAGRFSSEDWATDEVLNDDVPELLRLVAVAHQAP